MTVFTSRKVHTAKEGGPLKLDKRDQANFWTLGKGHVALYELSQYEIESQEDGLGFGLFPTKKESWFNLAETPKDVWNVDGDIWHASYIEIALANHKHIIKREVFTSLDFLGDIGGVFDGLCLIGSIFIRVMSYFTGNLL